MVKEKEETKEEVPEETKEDTEEKKPVMLGQIPTEYGLVYQTPDGVMNEKEYLAWMGNLLIEIKQGLVG